MPLVCVLVLVPLVLVAFPSCSHLETMGLETILQIQRTSSATATMVPTRLYFFPRFLPLVHSECTSKGSV